MGSRKYAGDYRLENVEKKNGKLKTVAVYKGASYVLEHGDKKPYAVKLLGVSAAVFWLVQIISFCLKTYSAHCIYVIMPQAFSLLSFWFVTMGVAMLIRSDDNMNREYAEKMRDRFSGGSVVSVLLTGGTLAGMTVAFIANGDFLIIPNDIINFGLMGIAFAASLACFINRKYVGVKTK